MMDGWYWFFFTMYILQIASIVCYSTYFIKTALKYMMFNFVKESYCGWKFSLMVGSVALTVGIIGWLYVTEVRLNHSYIMQTWIPVCFLYFQIKAITFWWKEKMKGK